MNKIHPIQGQIQNYQWGGFDYLKNLLRPPGDSHTPQAEYWLGVHPSAPSTVINSSTTLTEILQNNHTELNFLLKILDVRNMLSIQVHPNKEQAKAGFKKENSLSIPLAATHRNYKDDNHKPELMFALSEFWLLHGIKPEQDIIDTLSQHPALNPLAEYLSKNGLKNTFPTLLDTNSTLIQSLHRQLEEYLSSTTTPPKNTPDFWAQRWLSQNPGIYTGLLTLYFFNLIKLSPGESIFQPAGLLHAYLEGQNIELMANSDNVLRAGLTPKHMDIDELLNIATLDHSDPKDFFATPKKLDENWVVSDTPFDEFALSHLANTNTPTTEWNCAKGEILLCMQGEGVLSCDTEQYRFSTGDAFYISPKSQVSLSRINPSNLIFRALNL